eukprot:INCI17136.2.p2 GENE.INCI17136.2~~INCI17136.2.p2  ORF type:complete len:254 (-),score=43.80 INCI17136.2:61-822(-)
MVMTTLRSSCGTATGPSTTDNTPAKQKTLCGTPGPSASASPAKSPSKTGVGDSNITVDNGSTTCVQRLHYESHPEEERQHEDKDEVWEVNLDEDNLDIELWVPPAQRNKFKTVQVQVAPDGALGIEFRCRPERRQRKRRRRSRCHNPHLACSQRVGRQQQLLLVDNNIQVNSFVTERNPHVRAVQDVVPAGSTLQLWDGQPVENASKLQHLVQDMKRCHRQRQYDDAEAAKQGLGLFASTTIVTLTFALPLQQ